MGILEKITEIEREINRTQKNKGAVTQCVMPLLNISNSDGIPFGNVEGQVSSVSPGTARNQDRF